MGSWFRIVGCWLSLIFPGRRDLLQFASGEWDRSRANYFFLFNYISPIDGVKLLSTNKKPNKHYFPPLFSLSAKIRIASVQTIRIAERIVDPMNPLWYWGPSTCFQMTCGSHAWKTYAISFMLPMTRARSSLSEEQSSCDQLRRVNFHHLTAFLFVSGEDRTYAINKPLSPYPAPERI